ncbi:hypothetical protein THIOM_004951 [Candidatus Thiomargarita nelsonii]|uniref:Uncharacterized protein n=1 Tax=Candidatus Thiomargarita nelsonii TaxID=1003181 RepID=A0A0A6P0E6_9GAMM|nr:hypothetical protein THIOM_004951 [Candidatus Thiomargarita nelsonii]
MSDTEEITGQRNPADTGETTESGKNKAQESGENQTINPENPTEVENTLDPVEAEPPVETEETTELGEDHTQESGGEALGATNTRLNQEITQNGATINGPQANVTGNIDKLQFLFGPDKEADFKDPTTPFPAKPSELPDFELQGELEKHYNKLQQERIILINCLDENISLAASYAIAERLESYEKRMLSFSGENRQKTDLHVGIFANEKMKKSGEKLTVFVNLSSYSQSFFDSMFIKDRLEVEGIKQTFCKNNIMLVCIVNSDLIRDTLKTQQASFRFHHWNIWFLPHLLRNYFSEPEANYFEKKVLEQKQYGLWGKNLDDGDFYKLIQRYLRNDVEQFKEEVEKRTKYCEGNNVDDFLNSLQTVKLDNLFEGDDPLKKTVLYMVTFFPDLSPHDFEQMVLLLLADQKTTVYQDSRKENQNGVEKTVATPVEKNLTEIWEKNHRQILKDCHVKMVRSENDSLIVDFSEPYLRGELKRYFKQEDFLYLQRQFENLRDAGLLFNFDISDKVIENLITLSAEMAVSDPNYYGGERLVNIVVGLKQQLTSQRKTEIVIRLSKFIREMLNYPQLKEMIKEFLEKLMQAQHHDLILVIILGVTQRLQFASQFDALYWIKRLLDQGQTEIKDQAYDMLFQHAKQSGSRIYELLEMIKAWLPDLDRNVEKYSFANRYMLLFFIAYCGYTFSKFDENKYGQWPSKYPLFATIQENDEDSVNKLKLLVYWIFHPGIQSFLDNSLRDKGISGIQINANALRADFLDAWFAILLGFKQEAAHPEALVISDMLLQQIHDVISNNYDAKNGQKIKKAILEFWKLKQDIYLDRATKLKERSQKINSN